MIELLFDRPTVLLLYARTVDDADDGGHPCALMFAIAAAPLTSTAFEELPRLDLAVRPCPDVTDVQR